MKDFLGYKDEYLSTKKGYNLLRFFNPLHCMICGEVDSTNDGPFCEKCYNEFEKLLNSTCPVCGGSIKECVCLELSSIKKLYFLFWYDKVWSAEFVSEIKYGGDYRYISYFGKLIADVILNDSDKIPFSGVCYVPRSKRNVRIRGFDQSKLLAESVSYHLELPLLHCLKRIGKSEEQKKLSGLDRMENVKNKFMIDYSELVNEHGVIPSSLLLIDDVVTTGATVNECTSLLKKCGVRRVYVGAIAQTPFVKRKK